MLNLISYSLYHIWFWASARPVQTGIMPGLSVFMWGNMIWFRIISKPYLCSLCTEWCVVWEVQLPVWWNFFGFPCHFQKFSSIGWVKNAVSNSECSFQQCMWLREIVYMSLSLVVGSFNCLKFIHINYLYFSKAMVYNTLVQYGDNNVGCWLLLM